MAISAGSRLGPYEVVAPLGAGGMGEVYKARDTRLERTVAVKVLPRHLSSSEEMRQRFEREAKAISQLSHPHICALYDVGSHEGTEYLVMEYLEGETLAARLAKGALPLEQVLRFGVEIADALDKEHRQGIVHRDLKPGNVMLTKSGVKLLDFGLAKAVAPASAQSGLTSLPTVATPQNLTQQGTILGTFQYMAPEQLEGAETDVRSDIFALGAVLYEMATGQKAFQGKSQASLIGSILFSPSPRDTLLRASSAGGAPAPATELDASKRDYSHRFPFFLPDGRHFLYLAQSVLLGQGGGQEVCIGSLDSKERRSLLRVNSNALFAPSSPGAAGGHILFLRERTLLAQPFNAKGLRFSGEAFPVGEQVQYFGNFGFGVFTASDNGILAYQAGGAGGISQLVWLDRAGKQLEVLGPPADYLRPRLSRDGRRVGMDVRDPQTGRADIWIYDLARRVSTRFTFEPADNTYPIWSPDDSRIVFQSNRKGQGDLYQKVSSGTGNDEEFLVQEGSVKFANDWSSDGRFVVYHVIDAKSKTGWDLGFYSVAEKKTSLFLSTPATEVNGRFSPDGRWLAYQSDESGTTEVYVQPFPGHGGKWQISTAGGFQPVWNRNGKEIFYVSPDNKLMAVDVKADSGFEAGAPRALFDVHLKSITGWKYDVSPDGRRFPANVAIGEVKANPITLVENWTAELKK